LAKKLRNVPFFANRPHLLVINGNVHAVTAYWYGQGLLALTRAAANWLASGGSTVKVSLHTSTYTPNQDTHDFYDDLTNEVANGNGYTTGGATLTKADSTYDAASNETRMDGTDVVWSASTITARYAVIYVSTGTAGTSRLLGYIDFGADVVSVAGDFTITWAATGILKITAA
jgi:hypothetical protein